MLEIVAITEVQDIQGIGRDSLGNYFNQQFAVPMRMCISAFRVLISVFNNYAHSNCNERSAEFVCFTRELRYV